LPPDRIIDDGQNHQIARELDISRDMAAIGVTDGWSCKSELPPSERLQDAAQEHQRL